MLIGDVKLPEFFQPDNINNYCVPIINKMNELKTNDNFQADALVMFDEKYGEFEDKLLEIINIMKIEKEEFDRLRELYQQNQEKLRQLNDEIIVTKLERRPSIGLSKNTKNYPSWIDDIKMPNI